MDFKNKASLDSENTTDSSVHLKSLSTPISIRLNASLRNLEVDRWQPALTNEQDSSRAKSAYHKNNSL